MSTLKTTNIAHPSSASNNIVLDSSGNVVLQAGSASTPALQPTGDTNTGIFFPAADTIAFAEGGAEAARIDSSGRLLVGTTTSSSTGSFSGGKIQNYSSSANAVTEARSGSLADNQNSLHWAVCNSPLREAGVGVRKHSGIANPVGWLYLQEEDGGDASLWVDNSGNLRISSNIAHIGTTSGTVVGTQTSDERLKNIHGPVEYGLETVKQLEPVRFALKSEPDHEQLGFIAQQVQPLVPQSVFDTKEQIEGEPKDAPTKLGMEYVALIPVLVNAIKELSAEVDALKAQLQAP